MFYHFRSGLSSVTWVLLPSIMAVIGLAQVDPGCPPGTHLNSNSNKCVTCLNNSYTDSEYNREPECHQCTWCNDGKVQVSSCNVTHNTGCQCPPGKVEGPEGKCIMGPTVETLVGTSASTSVDYSSINIALGVSIGVGILEFLLLTVLCIAIWKIDKEDRQTSAPRENDSVLPLIRRLRKVVFKGNCCDGDVDQGAVVHSEAVVQLKSCNGLMSCFRSCRSNLRKKEDDKGPNQIELDPPTSQDAGGGATEDGAVSAAGGGAAVEGGNGDNHNETEPLLLGTPGAAGNGAPVTEDRAVSAAGGGATVEGGLRVKSLESQASSHVQPSHPLLPAISNGNSATRESHADEYATADGPGSLNAAEVPPRLSLQQVEH